MALSDDDLKKIGKLIADAIPKTATATAAEVLRMNEHMAGDDAS